MHNLILIFLIGYLLGIIGGLYIKSIPLLFILIIVLLVLYYIFLSTSILKKYRRYFKLIIKKEFIAVFLIGVLVSFFIVYLEEKKFDNLYNNDDELEIIATVIGEKKEKKYKISYKIRVDKISGKSDKYKNTNLLLNIKKTNEYMDLKYGMQIKIKGKYLSPSISRNKNGFSYKNYLKSINIYGNINCEGIEVIKDNNINCIYKLCNDIKVKIKDNLNDLFSKKEGDLLLGILTGDTDEIDEEIKEDFRISNLYHMLAVSGAHVSYIILGIGLVLNNLYINKKIAYIITIFSLIFFVGIVGYSPSVTRAVIMAIVLLISYLVNRKHNIINSISLSMLIILFINPFSVYNIGFWLSYGGTIGIVFFYSILAESVGRFLRKLKKKISFIINNSNSICSEKTNSIIIYKANSINTLLSKIKNSTFRMMCVTLSAQIVIMPIMILNFNTISLTFIISNLIAGYLMGAITIGGFLICIISFISKFISNIFSIPLNLILDVLITITKVCSKIPISVIYITTPNAIFFIIYYIFLFLVYFKKNLYRKNHLSYIQKKVLIFFNKIELKFKKNKSKLLILISIMFLFFFIFQKFPKDLKIYFIDVGQGDSCLLITPYNKKILIDGGGSEISDSFDVGEEVLLPYLLGRGIKTLDYIIVSHFDSDHVGGLLSIMNKIKVKNVVISVQGKESENYLKFKEIVKEKKIKVIVVNKGDNLQIENGVNFDILWPDKKKLINENILNNNSIVCKLSYKNFSMLFTGDIEEIAENQILEEYKYNLQLFNCSILKVAHHGSKTSSTQKFLQIVNPKIALIGARENNKFGHPNDEVIKRLESMRYNNLPYRSDGRNFYCSK